MLLRRWRRPPIIDPTHFAQTWLQRRALKQSNRAGKAARARFDHCGEHG
jgi:hypothetical protein